MVVSQSQIGTAAESHYLKSGNFFEVATEVVALSSLTESSTCQMPFLFPTFYLAFAALENLFITLANFEDHIIKFDGLQFVERKGQLLNINVNQYKNVNC